MSKARRPHPVYDAKRPAVEGKWVTYHKEGNIITIRGHRTEYDANQALGLKGGSRDPNFNPENAA